MFELIATATFGLEAVVRREIEELGYEIIKTEDGKVTFAGDERAIVRSNLWLRCADRVLLKTCEFQALEFEDLFQGIKAYPWEDIIPEDGKFTVTCSTVKSKLHNPPAIQSVSKKAIVERMSEAYGIERFAETGAEYTVKVTMLKDRATITIDTSGSGLHKRGYRVAAVDAPIKETLAAALVQLSFFRPGRILADPCCGSGTIPIEAAMIGMNIAVRRNAPGIGFAIPLSRIENTLAQWMIPDRSGSADDERIIFLIGISAQGCDAVDHRSHPVAFLDTKSFYMVYTSCTV